MIQPDLISYVDPFLPSVVTLNGRIIPSFSSFPPFWRADGSHSYGASTVRGPVLVSLLTRPGPGVGLSMTWLLRESRDARRKIRFKSNACLPRICDWAPFASMLQPREWRQDSLTAHAAHSQIGDTARSSGASAADLVSPESLLSVPPLRRDTPAGVDPVLRLGGPLDHVGCHAICSMRARIWRKRGPVK